MKGLAALLGSALLLVLLLPSAGPAQERPRIGLALSGGGARGLAHVGVLRELEAQRIPIDMVAGTSMGAVVGGLYASGLSPDEIEALVDTVDWEALLSETPPRSALGYRSRAEQRRTPVAFEIGLAGGGIRLPGGLLTGQPLDLLLRRLTLPVAAIDDFSALPIPFAAVATDIERGERVVLRDGDLVEAVRASMAIPVVFSPVEIDGRLLTDGGLVDNLPVEIVRSMGADVVIAVDAAPRLEGGPHIRTIPGIVDQIVAIVGRQRIEESLALADVAITPDLEGFGLFEFDEATVILERGAAATRDAGRDLEPLALSERAYGEWRAARIPLRPPDEIDRVDVVVPARVDPRRIRARLDLRPPFPLDADLLEHSANRVFALGGFERVTYAVEREGAKGVVTIRAIDDLRGRDVMRFGLRLVTDTGGADLRTGIVTFTGRAAWMRSDLNARGGESRLEVRLGQTNAILGELHQPLDFAGRWFVEPGGRVESARQPLVDDGRVVAEYDVLRLIARLDGGLVLGLSTEARLGLAFGRIDAEVDPGPPGLLPDLDDRIGAVTASVTHDRLDDADWPLEGLFARATAFVARDGLGSVREYERLTFDAHGFATRGRITGFAGVEAGTDLDSGLPAYDDFRLGGFFSLSGFGPDELRGSRLALGRLGTLVRLAQLPPALHGVFAGGWVEVGDAWTGADDPDARWAVTGALGAETILGPVWLAYGRGEGDRDRVYVALGPAFAVAP